ncbi:glycosyltransferase [Variovorax sp. RHLX14]|uniref:glycosyltransferase n=1 Tax=Variovorax sp. RHLX14 TaxID=1259731 RepID=UPI003F456E23
MKDLRQDDSEKPTTSVARHCVDVCAVVITYQPQLDVLSQVLDSVAPQVGQVLLFDNATAGSAFAGFPAFLERAEADGVVVVRSPTNVGLGAAMNRAAAHACAAGFTYLLLLDQDSLLDPRMVATLKAAYEDLGRTELIAAVGPQFSDRRNGHVAPFIEMGFPLNRKLYGRPGQRVRCDFLISSGSLIPLDVLEHIGGMDERLFIDNVDMEWCFRARHHGFALFGICDARMRHSIGDTLRATWLKPGGVMIHKPIRLYYIMRNRVLLYGRKETPKVWIAQDVPRLLLKFLGTALFVAPRMNYVRMMVRGLLDGVLGRSGPFDGR